MRAITSNGGKGMRIKHQSVKIQYSSSSQLTLYSSILILSVCVGATRGMLLMDDLFGEIAFGTSLNLSNDQSSKQLIEAKKYNVPGITRILQAGSLLLLLCPAQGTLQKETTPRKENNIKCFLCNRSWSERPKGAKDNWDWMESGTDRHWPCAKN